MSIAIDQSRLQGEIDTLALITEAEPPIVTRVLFSEADLRGREFVKKLCHETGLVVREDAVGNMFARWEGAEQHLPAAATGSHIDAIPNAGKFDGVVGVLGAIEAMRALRLAGFRPRRAIELIVFTAEEPTRFGIGCLGSRLLGGVLSPETAAGLLDGDGKSLDVWRQGARAAWARWPRCGWRRRCTRGLVELHIEQGPDSGARERRHWRRREHRRAKCAPGGVDRRGRPRGSGPDAGAARCRPGRCAKSRWPSEKAFHALNSGGSPDTVGTTGVFRIEPGAVNSVPYRAWLEIDLRDTNGATRDAALEQIETAAAEICKRRGVTLRMERLNADPPATCDPGLVSTISGICRRLGVLHRRMISRAYHDSLFMARICPTTMIFIPCRGGVSHRPDEFSTPEQIGTGVRVLAETLAALASD